MLGSFFLKDRLFLGMLLVQVFLSSFTFFKKKRKTHSFLKLLILFPL